MPVHNADIAAIFTEIAELLEIQGANPFRIRAYHNAAITIGEFGRDLPALIRKFHLAKLAAAGDWHGIQKDEATRGAIPADIKTSIGLDPITDQPINPSTSQPSVILWGTGSPRREFLHVDDLADACLFLMNHYDESEPINIGWGKDQTIRELAQTISDVVGYQGPIKWDFDKPDGTPRKLLDVSRLTEKGWQAKISLEEGVREVYRWYLGK